MPTVLKSGSLNLLEPSGPVQACNGNALPFKPLFNFYIIYVIYNGYCGLRNTRWQAAVGKAWFIGYVEVLLHSFLSSAVYEGVWLTLRPAALSYRKSPGDPFSRAPGPIYTFWKSDTSCFSWDSNLISSSPGLEQMYSSTISLNAALDGVGGQAHAPAVVPLG